MQRAEQAWKSRRLWSSTRLHQREDEEVETRGVSDPHAEDLDREMDGGRGERQLTQQLVSEGFPWTPPDSPPTPDPVPSRSDKSTASSKSVPL